MQDNYGLLIASLVAIVAIVGLVILFSGASSTGAIPSCPYVCDTPGGPGQGAVLCSDVPCAQIPSPFWSVQDADARRQAIAWGGFETV